jgi:4-hydroxy-tetrahydrodipicolinate reductase
MRKLAQKQDNEEPGRRIGGHDAGDRTMIRVCIAGATGWAGRAVAAGVVAAQDLAMQSAVARSAAGNDLGSVLGGQALGVTIRSSVEEALDGVDVLVDYTSHTIVKRNTLIAIDRGVAVVVGASGLTAADFEEIDMAACSRGVGVIAAGNFSLTAAMTQAAAALVAGYLPQAEIIDYGYAAKPDVPSGTARELAERLARVRRPVIERPLDAVDGPLEARGVTVAGVQVHSVRLPSFSVSTEVIFGLADERLTIRHDAGRSAEPYVAGTLLAIRRVMGRVGLTRGLDTLLLGDD